MSQRLQSHKIKVQSRRIPPQKRHLLAERAARGPGGPCSVAARSYGSVPGRCAATADAGDERITRSIPGYSQVGGQPGFPSSSDPPRVCPRQPEMRGRAVGAWGSPRCLAARSVRGDSGQCH